MNPKTQHPKPLTQHHTRLTCLYRAVKDLRVDIETGSVLSAGQTVCDVWGQSGKKPNVRVCVAMRVGEFWTLMCDAVDRADAACPVSATTGVV